MDDTLFGTRNKRGDWQPFGTIRANPRHFIPFQPLKLLKWLFGWPGYNK